MDREEARKYLFEISKQEISARMIDVLRRSDPEYQAAKQKLALSEEEKKEYVAKIFDNISIDDPEAIDTYKFLKQSDEEIEKYMNDVLARIDERNR